MTLEPGTYTPEEIGRERYGMEFTQTGGLPVMLAARGCICSYTWADGKPVRNGAVGSCLADHSAPSSPGAGMPPALTPEAVRQLLSECVTVVKPGEVLAVRLPLDVNGDDMRRAREYALEVEQESGIKVAFIPGEEFAAIDAGMTVGEARKTTGLPALGDPFADKAAQRGG